MNSLSSQEVKFSKNQITLLCSLVHAGILPGQTEDHRKHGHGNEASNPAAAAGQSQAVRGGAYKKAGPRVAPPTEFTLLE